MTEQTQPAYMFPTSVKEVERLGWDYIDIILFSGDAFIDHPSSGTAMIARVLQREGWRVAVVPQPGWQDDLRDFRKLGVPRLFFGVNSGAMDSMVNHYTAAKRLRSNDAYTPGGQAGHRPDYAVTVYTRILKRLYPDVPVVIGGIEASLRRLTHYDYWADRLFPSVLVDSGADLLIYGMGERPVTAVARAIAAGEDLRGIPQTAFFAEEPCPRAGEGTLLCTAMSGYAATRTHLSRISMWRSGRPTACMPPPSLNPIPVDMCRSIRHFPRKRRKNLIRITPCPSPSSRIPATGGRTFPPGR